MIKLTFITTIFNVEQIFVKQLFDSFSDLINSNELEFIIIDDSSTNKISYDYLWEKYSKNSNFKFHIMTNNTKRSGAFAKGIEMASNSMYLMSLDSDDLVNPDSLKNIIKLLPSVDSDLILNSIFRRDYNTGNLFYESVYNGSPKAFISNNDIGKFSHWPTFAAFNTIVRTSVAKNSTYNVRDVICPHDDAYFGQVWISNSKNIYFLDEPFFIYNINQPWTTNSGSDSIRYTLDSHWKLCLEIMKLYNKNNPFTKINIKSILKTHYSAVLKLPFFRRIKWKFKIYVKKTKYGIFKYKTI